MNAALEAHIAERQRQIEVLRELYRFSPIEAEDFAERFPTSEAEPIQGGQREPRHR